MEDDFAATTTIGERVAPAPVANVARDRRTTTGPSFGVNPKLEPFVLLAKSARGAAAANLISQVCAAPGVYVFSELLELASINELQSSEQHAQSHRLLELFAYGTWTDYQREHSGSYHLGLKLPTAQLQTILRHTGNQSSVPALNDAQQRKLKQLSILTLAQDNRNIPYAVLLDRLNLDSVASLEELLIDAFYSGVMTGRLDQKEARVEVLTSIGRDVKPSTSSATTTLAAASGATEAMEVDANSINVTHEATPTVETLTLILSTWLSTITSLLSSLDQHLQHLTNEANDVKTRSNERDQHIQQVIDEVVKSSGKDAKASGATKGLAQTVGEAFADGPGAFRDAFTSVRNALTGKPSSHNEPVDGGGGGGDMDVDGAHDPKGAHARARKRGRA
ncbi:hypothetical protein OIO90_004967 [Microbotryomycetes sp. JL221]|nr:hypothetical protein OIO90_004967 [Microbotryomycetes sp. JL221]